MPDKLPKGWVRTTLGEICVPVGTIYPEDEPNAEFTYFDIGGIDGDQNRITETKTINGRSAPSRARQAVQKGDILFSTVRTNLRKIARIEQDYPKPVGSTGFAVIRAAPGVSGDFVFQQVLSEPFLQPLHALQSGSSYPAVRDRDIFGQPIVLPPSFEQKRIVAKLDTVLSHVAAGMAAAQRALADLQHYRAAVLHAALTGELTRAWRETHPVSDKNASQLLKCLLHERRIRWEEAEFKHLQAAGKQPKDDKWKSRYSEPRPPEASELPELPKEWKWSSLEMLAELGSGISVSQSRTVENPVEVPYLRVANVLRGALDLSEMKKISVSREQLDSFLLKTGDILFNEGGDRDKLGRGWIWEGQIPKCVHQNHVFRARLVNSSLMDAKLISHWGNTFGQQYFIRHGTQTTNLASINRSVLAKLPVPIVPLSEQHEIIRQVEHRLVMAYHFESAIESALRRTRVWRQSIFYAGFAGRLASQSDNDESASVLLEQIRAIRETLAAQPKPKRGRKIKMKTTRRPILEVMKEKSAPIKPEELFAAAGFDEASVEAFFAELKELHAGKKIRERRDPHERGLVLLEVRL
jgi:type I restriction enzyme S subunit